MVVGLFLAAPAGFAPAQQSWQTFNCPDGKCSVLLPAGPVTSIAGINVFYVNLYINNMSSDVNFSFSYTDYPPLYASDSASKELAEKFAAVVSGKTVLYHRMIDLNGGAGQAYAYRSKDGTLVQARDYYKNQRLYQLYVISAYGQYVPAKTVTIFLNSLDIH